MKTFEAFARAENGASRLSGAVEKFVPPPFDRFQIGFVL